jgi:hypothetical protein
MGAPVSLIIDALLIAAGDGDAAARPTVEGSAKEMREFIDQRIRWWG